jgi:hypothetical protein
VISGFGRDTDEICPLLGYNAASSGNSLPTFRENVSVPSSRVKKSKKLFLDFLTLEDGPIRCPETSVTDYHLTLRYTPEERKSCIFKYFDTFRISAPQNEKKLRLHLIALSLHNTRHPPIVLYKAVTLHFPIIHGLLHQGRIWIEGENKVLRKISDVRKQKKGRKLAEGCCTILTLP